MNNTNAKSEGAAYLSAVHVKENFRPTEADFLPANLPAAIQRMDKAHNDMESHYEKLATEELQQEFALIRKEIKNYLVVLKSIHDIEAKDAQQWQGIRFYLEPTVDGASEPTMEQQQAARKLLQRFSGFSTSALPIIESLIKKRMTHEEDKVKKLMERRKKSGGSGFLSKLGIKF